MTPDQLAACRRFAAGPNDAYTIHEAQRAVAALLDELPTPEHMADVLARTVRPFDEALADQHEAA